ncbi:Aldehyde dehydrogenase [Podosphaera aphanis]|nr:Aldehyde dehydrogenase [Podosphaera aphanis]
MSELHLELKAPNGRKYVQPLGIFINNEWIKSSNDKKIISINPTDETIITSVYAASSSDVDAAVASARSAFEDSSWRNLTPTERGNLLILLSELVLKHSEILATIETWDNGKTFASSLEDVKEVADVFKYYGGYADKIHGQVIDTGPAKFAYTIKEPIGVCGQIIPWNYPLAMAAWKLGPALACGNTTVIKAAEQTPLSILYLANLFKEAGFPPGVVNILNGYGHEAGVAIAKHVGINKVAFTGSTITGKEIMSLASCNMKSITLETGGKSPLLVFNDADLEQAVNVMSNQGQICTATSRILVQEDIYDSFLTLFLKEVQKVSVVGDPFVETTFQGPQVTKAQYERVLNFIQIGKAEGATLVLGGEPLTKATPSGRGYFIAPTVFKDTKPSMRIFQEEVFGPFVVFASFKTEAEALELANNSVYGLGSAIFTKDITRAHRVAKSLEAGTVWINSSNDSDYRIPFGGFKESGIGRELGEEGLTGYYQIKAVHINMGLNL